MVVTVIRRQDTEVLTPRHRLRALSSFSDPVVGEFHWAVNEHDYKATHARAMKRNYLSLNLAPTAGGGDGLNRHHLTKHHSIPDQVEQPPE